VAIRLTTDEAAFLVSIKEPGKAVTRDIILTAQELHEIACVVLSKRDSLSDILEPP
jgi:hypothetical protein